MTVRKRVIVSGRVQGVFYRDACRRKAVELDVAGSAENLGDGTVEVFLEGDAAAVDQVISWCRAGTAGSKVERVEIADDEPQGSSGFRIL